MCVVSGRPDRRRIPPFVPTYTIMKIPKTTQTEPYIEFRIDSKGVLTVNPEPTSDWWGGKNGGFVASEGFEGNTCRPEDLELYVKVFKEKKIETIEKEISVLQKQLKKLKATL